MKKENAVLGSGVIAALAASSCCIPPVVAAIAGIGGVSSGLSWMEPLRPYMIGLAVVSIGYAWYDHLKPKKETDCCPLEKPKFYQSRSFLIGITLFSLISIGFPYFTKDYFPEKLTNDTIVTTEENMEEKRIEIEGMTCVSCEHHMNTALMNSDGVIEASSSFEEGYTNVRYDKTKTDLETLKKQIENETGYKTK